VQALLGSRYCIQSTRFISPHHHPEVGPGSTPCLYAAGPYHPRHPAGTSALGCTRWLRERRTAGGVLTRGGVRPSQSPPRGVCACVHAAAARRRWLPLRTRSWRARVEGGRGGVDSEGAAAASVAGTESRRPGAGGVSRALHRTRVAGRFNVCRLRAVRRPVFEGLQCDVGRRTCIIVLVGQGRLARGAPGERSGVSRVAGR
jgi:hypothetical protein